MTDNRLPVTICWHCDRPLDAAESLDSELWRPEPGAVSLCMYCGAVAIFGPDMRLERPTGAQLDELARNAEFRHTWARFMWARQQLMLDHNLLRDRKDPDR